MNAPVVIIGTGLAGYNLAREFRKLDSETPLLLITADDGRSYSKPMLSTGFGKNKDADGLTCVKIRSAGSPKSRRDRFVRSCWRARKSVNPRAGYPPKTCASSSCTSNR